MMSTPKPKPKKAKHRKHNEPYEPTPDEIAEATKKIREVGYTDRRGDWQRPWGKFEYDQRERTDGR